MNRLSVKRSQETKGRLLSAVLTRLPGAWFSPSDRELVTLYRMRYKMALDERKYDSALIFLNKILEVDPLDLDAKYSKGEIYHRHLGDFTRAVEHYNKVIRLTADRQTEQLSIKARTSLNEIMELFS